MAETMTRSFGMRERRGMASFCAAGLSCRRRSVPPAPHPGPRHGGFTLFELILAIVLMTLFAGILLGRFLFYQEAAEKAAMERTVNALRSAIDIKVATLIARGRSAEIAELARANPVDLLSDKPGDYAGAYYHLATIELAPGHWYYDLQDRQLVYVVEHGAHFAADKEGRKWVRYQMALVRDGGGVSSAEPASGEVTGVLLRQVAPYAWKPG